MSDQSDRQALATMPPGSVIITPGQMYAEIRDMAVKVDKLTAIIDPALTTIREDVAEVVADVADHESRIRAVERRLWVAAGIAAAAGTGLSQILPALAK